MTHHSFGSTPNFPNFYKEIKSLTDSSGRLAYAGYDPSLGEPPTEAQKELLQNYSPEMPTLTLTGSEKLHGENMAVAVTKDEIWVQGRNHIRTVADDQNGMAQFVVPLVPLFIQLASSVATLNQISLDTHTIVLDGEWAGGNIQKGNAACSGTEKGFYIFDYVRAINNEDPTDFKYIRADGMHHPEYNVYSMKHFSEYSITLDLNDPDKCEAELQELAELIEAKSPIAGFFERPDNVGEGVYLWGIYNGKPVRVKAKGLKHGGKPKDKGKPSTNSLSDSQKDALTQLADALTPEWRINQAITETNASEKKDIGKVIQWVKDDIVKEETPTLEKASTDLKQVQGFVAKIVKDYFFDSLKDY